MEMPRGGDTRDLAEKLEVALAQAAGVKCDNHVVYVVTTESGKRLYIMFSDLMIHFGLSVNEGCW